ncbi:MAG TPA: hypothetical protein VLZ73_05960 [Brevundimonas sp.]|nr:hypothetical protein [Brevundimonas sp.]
MKVVVLSGLALGLTALAAGGWAAWNSTAIAHRDMVGAVMHIEVVAPREPDLPAPSIMAVGELRDGYVHDPERLQPPAVLDAEYAYIDDAWEEPEPWVEPPQPEGGLVWTSLRPPVPPRLEPHDYSYGFDQPLPDATARDAGDAGASSPKAPADTSPWDERGLD